MPVNRVQAGRGRPTRLANRYALPMDASVMQLLPLYQRERAAGRAMALALVLSTAGSTYSKRGALLLIARDGEYAGLLSGGCLEGDLRERAGTVIADGRPQRISYDMRGPDDELWGLGAGCEGAMDILMLRVGADEDWQPLHFLQQAMNSHVHTALAVVVESRAQRKKITPNANQTGRSPTSFISNPATC